MTRLRLLCLLLLVFTTLAPAQRRRDPLTDAEINQMRDAAQEPQRRSRLLIKFAKARMLAIEQLRSDSKLAEGRGQAIHNLLEDFTHILEELEGNLDMYERQRYDLRKPAKEMIEAYTEWQLKLRALKETSETTAEYKRFDFVLETAMDVTKAGMEITRDLLDEQNKSAAEKKK